MPRATLRKVGGSVMVAVPPAYLDRTGLGARAEIDWELEGNRLIIQPSRDPLAYVLADLLAECDPSAPISSDPAWTEGREVGGELV